MAWHRIIRWLHLFFRNTSPIVPPPTPSCLSFFLNQVLIVFLGTTDHLVCDILRKFTIDRVFLLECTMHVWEKILHIFNNYVFTFLFLTFIHMYIYVCSLNVYVVCMCVYWESGLFEWGKRFSWEMNIWLTRTNTIITLVPLSLRP